MKKNKFIVFVQLAAFSLLIFACDKDDDDFGFIDQELSGKIDGQEYTSSAGGGQAVEWVFDDTRSDVTIGGSAISDPCDYAYEGPTVSFIILNEAGVYALDEDWVSDASVGQVLVYLHPDGSIDSENFIIVSDGTIEILSTNSKTISGRVNARLDDNNFVNGNFTVSYCQE